ncbi:MAG: aminoacyl-tRNA hydrolase [Candidatus Berkelbacteria bacterium]|nr:aminoacyl-tRNA hydrolase [Candidatus Berkelbacteria bacterium]
MIKTKFLIVGLGNPGKDYEKTRHNIGFEVADNLVKTIEPFGNLSFGINKKLKAAIIKTKIGDSEVIIAKPLTFMNLSGEAVHKMMENFGVKPQDVVVISDDSNLEVGQIRVRFSGESGGHNGLKSIISSIGNDFWRIRIGIGNNEKIALEKFVLEKIPKNDRESINASVDKVVEYLIESISKNKMGNQTIN